MERVREYESEAGIGKLMSGGDRGEEGGGELSRGLRGSEGEKESNSEENKRQHLLDLDDEHPVAERSPLVAQARAIRDC
eukprot:6199318-Pleurochrysis_carterae.AAC.5